MTDANPYGTKRLPGFDGHSLLNVHSKWTEAKMRRTLLKSKIHRATVTEAALHYEGSITLDPILMEAADLIPFEKVDIYDISNGSRLSTYVIEGTSGSGEIQINGAAAKLVHPGDLVIIASYADFDEAELGEHQPIVISVDEQNRIREHATSSEESSH